MCRAQLERARKLDIDHLALLFHFGGLSQERTLDSMKLFMTEVAAGF